MSEIDLLVFIPKFAPPAAFPFLAYGDSFHLVIQAQYLCVISESSLWPLSIRKFCWLYLYNIPMSASTVHVLITATIFYFLEDCCSLLTNLPVSLTPSIYSQHSSERDPVKHLWDHVIRMLQSSNDFISHFA